MARTWTKLFPQACSWQNLLQAWQRCRRGKRYSVAAADFALHWDQNLLRIQTALTEGTWRPGPYRHFHISQPKPRLISAAPFSDRVVHHAIVQVLEPIFERRFIFDSYACRRGKGTHAAISRTQHFLRRYPWSLKTDIVRFFPNVDHQLLRSLLGRHIRDPRFLSLLDLVIDSGVGVLDNPRVYQAFPGDNLFSILRPVGLPIGNLTSQFFANVFLDPLDHYIREVLRVPGYVRYCDDLVLFGNSREQMWQYRDAVGDYLKTIRLRLHPHKTHVAPQHRGVNFLGFSIQPNQRRLLTSAIRRFSGKLALMQWQLQQGLTTFSAVARSIRSWMAHSEHANSTGIQRTLMRRVVFRRCRDCTPRPVHESSDLFAELLRDTDQLRPD
jgi:retron-type reverse transcriptase